MDWIYIDEFNKCPNTDFIFCDTRDFHILCRDGNRAEKHRTDKGICRSGGTLTDCKFNQDEIFGVLKKLEQQNGGKGEWRMIPTKIGSGWLKYVRFFKTEEVTTAGEPVYICYTTSGDDYFVVSRNELNKTIDSDTLNFIE